MLYRRLTSFSYEQFRYLTNVTDLDFPYQYASVSFSETATRATAQRLRRTRQHLGSYRHDLMIAMRVVNNVEREMIRAEWENWLLDENMRCKQVEVLLREPPNSASKSKKNKPVVSQQVLDAEAKERTRLDGLRQWQQHYCGSCRFEQDMMLNDRKHSTFG
jgi:hypothetical protein